MIVRSGIGYDVHRFISGRPLRLGGVEIPHSHGLDGHSDADVVLHAITDALLGAAALGDIGQHFPPSDPSWRDANSTVFLTYAGRLINQEGYLVVNIDVTIIAEEPKVGPHTAGMREAIAKTLNLTVSDVGIKATTNEGLGSIGRGEGIAALAIATIQSRGLKITE
jgi:2-C-methyl-D-erythritol 2,4-cyclodiphosphate synthase